MMRKTAKILARSMRRLSKTTELLDASRMFLNHCEALNGEEREKRNGLGQRSQQGKL